MISKKGQGMSLNVIIIAALALIVLVVLIAIFTGRISLFNRGVGEAGDAEITTLRISYGDCQPTISRENTFKTQFSQAATDDDKDRARSEFRGEIDRCDQLSNDKALCESIDCKWP